MSKKITLLIAASFFLFPLIANAEMSYEDYMAQWYASQSAPQDPCELGIDGEIDGQVCNSGFMYAYEAETCD